MLEQVISWEISIGISFLVLIGFLILIIIRYSNSIKKELKRSEYTTERKLWGKSNFQEFYLQTIFRNHLFHLDKQFGNNFFFLLSSDNTTRDNLAYLFAKYKYDKVLTADLKGTKPNDWLDSLALFLIRKLKISFFKYLLIDIARSAIKLTDEGKKSQLDYQELWNDTSDILSQHNICLVLLNVDTILANDSSETFRVFLEIINQTVCTAANFEITKLYPRRFYYPSLNFFQYCLIKLNDRSPFLVKFEATDFEGFKFKHYIKEVHKRMCFKENQFLYRLDLLGNQNYQTALVELHSLARNLNPEGKDFQKNKSYLVEEINRATSHLSTNELELLKVLAFLPYSVGLKHEFPSLCRHFNLKPNSAQRNLLQTGLLRTSNSDSYINIFLEVQILRQFGEAYHEELTGFPMSNLDRGNQSWIEFYSESKISPLFEIDAKYHGNPLGSGYYVPESILKLIDCPIYLVDKLLKHLKISLENDIPTDHERIRKWLGYYKCLQAMQDPSCQGEISEVKDKIYEMIAVDKLNRFTITHQYISKLFCLPISYVELSARKAIMSQISSIMSDLNLDGLIFSGSGDTRIGNVKKQVDTL